MIRTVLVVCVVLSAALSSAPRAAAQDGVTLSGRVLNSLSGDPIPGVVVVIEELGRTTTSAFAIHRACPLRSACIISIPRTVRHAVVNRLNPSIGRVRRLMNRWSCSMTLFRYLHWRRDERGRKNPSCLMASNAIG